MKRIALPNGIPLLSLLFVLGLRATWRRIGMPCSGACRFGADSNPASGTLSRKSRVCQRLPSARESAHPVCVRVPADEVTMTERRRANGPARKARIVEDFPSLDGSSIAKSAEPRNNYLRGAGSLTLPTAPFLDNLAVTAPQKSRRIRHSRSGNRAVRVWGLRACLPFRGGVGGGWGGFYSGWGR